MIVVGVGCGPGMLTEDAIAAIEEASLIYGSERALELASAHIGEECETIVIQDYKGLRDLPEETIVLSTGDPMLAGLGYLCGRVIPGISSYQYACAKLVIPMTRTVIVNAHAKDRSRAIEEVCFELSREKIVFIITDPGFNVEILASAIRESGISGCRIAVCERLGYPDEVISTGGPDDPPVPCSPLFVVVAGNF